ncbi:bifunctional RNase H/acid phosphatase [Ornithinimicrobium sp. Arc0846-15]|nr:bifunctional RNase H/acid phosphatase [Ornithinimicrobium laminariae]
MSRRLIVEADGGSRGNPGVAGYGALVQDVATGELLAERAAPLGKESNNVAEYSGLIAGLQAVVDLGLAEKANVAVRMDSKLVIEQMAGRWKIKHEAMRRLALEARDLVHDIQRQGGSISWQWIPRGENEAADALSNDGMDGLTIRRDHVEPAAKVVETEPSESKSAQAESAQGSLFDDPVADGPGTGDDSSTPVAEVAMSARASLVGGTRIYLVRHGVTDFTLASKLDGRAGSNPELAPEGLAQAAAVGQAIKDRLAHDGINDAVVLTSTLRRAQQTGGAIAEQLDVEAAIDEDWDEQAFGDWDGMSMADLAGQSRDDLKSLWSDVDYSRPGGESHRALATRVVAALHRAIAMGDTVIVATHRKPLLCVLSEVLGMDHERVWALATDPASITALDIWPDGGARVAFLNDTHHLQSLATTAPKP